MNDIKRYAAALLPGLIILLGQLQLALADRVLDQTETTQLLIVIATVLGTYFVPLVPGAWSGAAKTGVAIFGAVAALIVPTIVAGWDPNTLIGFALAILSALATEIGVQVRKSAAEPTTYQPVDQL